VELQDGSFAHIFLTFILFQFNGAECVKWASVVEMDGARARG
jgi:hypothetical protein